MSGNSELLVKISGDVKDFQDALDEVKAKTQDLDQGLSQVAKVSAIAFAALTAEIGFAVAAYGESEAASNRLTTALQNQGIYSDELAQSYKAQAAALQELTGVDDDAIVGGQAMLQGMIGQTEISRDLTQAVLDLSAAQGIDLDTAFQTVGKAIQGNVGALGRYGVQIDDNLSKQERLAQITAQLSNRFGGQAEAANRGLGGIRGLTSAFGELQESIGQRFAPVISSAIASITSFLKSVSNNEGLMDLISAGLAFATAFAGVTTVAAGAGVAFLSLKALAIAAGTSLAALAAPIGIAVAAIAALSAGIAFLVFNWDSGFPRMTAALRAFVENISELASGVGRILAGIFTMDLGMIRQGIADARAALQQGLSEYKSDVEKALAERTAAEQKAADDRVKANNDGAARLEAEERAREARAAATRKAQQELLVLQVQGASQEIIDLKRQEADTLAQIENDQNARIRGILQSRLAEIRQEQVLAADEEKLRRQTFNEEVLAQNEAFEAMSDEQKARFLEKNRAQLESQILTEQTARDEAARRQAQAQIQAHNQFLLNQQRFGTAYAKINELMNSEVYRGAQSASQDLAQLQSSSNSKLKAIGKAAAIANIAMKTAESAMNIYAGFSTIPIIGPALGVAGAAAAIAFGAEQAGRVRAAADGGLVTGPGGPRSDRVPFMLSPGELIVPERNFDEVVNAVASQRIGSGRAPGSGAGEGSGGGEMAHVVLELRGTLAEIVETQISERQRLGISILRTT